MSIRPLHDITYRPQFSGHETFPLRYGWLKKAYDCVEEFEDKKDNKLHCWGEGAITRFGVGKNMVSSIRHWSTSCGIIEEKGTSYNTTKLGRYLFGRKGLDPYLENPSSLWVIHWKLASNPKKTTWFWAFNHYPSRTFSRQLLVQKINQFTQDRGWRCSQNTIFNDISCFIRTYTISQKTGIKHYDSLLESQLTELGIIKPLDDKEGFRFVNGSKPSLGDGIFIFSLLEFWSNYTNAKTLPFEAIVYKPGSPGRVFSMDEEEMLDRLSNIDEITKGKLLWSEVAGLKQVIKNYEFDEEMKFSFLSHDYLKYKKGRVSR